jgi:hypothetical protein
MSQRVRVFISHSAREPKEANDVRTAIREMLQSKEHNDRYAVLMDDLSLSPGDAWRSSINLWLGTCDAAIVILSKKALLSDYVAFELSILGYRRWRAHRDGREFRIIPVLVDVTMEEVEQSRLKPTQVGEWMSTITGSKEAIAQKIVAALDGVVTDDAIPIENMARVLDAHLPSNDFYLEQAAAALGKELPWDVSEGKRFCLALQLLGAGMSTPAVKAVRQLRRDPGFQEPFLPTIENLLSSSWVDLTADDIYHHMRQKEPPALVLNASFPDTARMYVRSAQYRRTPVLNCVIAEPNTIIEELEESKQGDDAAYRERIVAEVRKELFAKFQVSTQADLDLALSDSASFDEPVVVAIKAPSIKPATLAALHAAFSHVTFFLLTGRKFNDVLTGKTVYAIRPHLGEKDEEACRKQFDEFRRLMNRPLGEKT